MAWRIYLLSCCFASLGLVQCRRNGPRRNVKKPATNGIVYAPLNIWPYPKSLSFGDADALGPHRVGTEQELSVSIKGCRNNLTTILAESTYNKKSIMRVTARSYDTKPYALSDAACPVSRRCSFDSDCATGSCFTQSSRRWNSTHACPPSAKFSTPCGCCVPGSLPVINTIDIECTDDSDIQGFRTPDMDAYQLNVTSAGISIRAKTSTGAAYALVTLAQIVRRDTGKGSMAVLDRVPVFVEDEPKFSWRGIMVDVSRHFVPLEQLMSVVDAVFAAKMSVFHLHLTDAPSFPYVSKKYPELATEGEWSHEIHFDGSHPRTSYTAAEIGALAEYAKERFVQLMVEVDTPAHTMSWGRGHPEVMADCWEWLVNKNPKVDVDSDDCIALDPTSESARTIVADILAEISAVVGDAHTFLHLGGDEVKSACWDSVPHIREYVEKRFGNNSDVAYRLLQVEWTRQVTTKAAKDAGKVPVLWQSTTQGPLDPAWDPNTAGLPDDTVYMSWLSAESTRSYAEAGLRVITTNGFYETSMDAEESQYLGDGWQSFYDVPVLPSGLDEKAKSMVLGGQVCVWGEGFDGGDLAAKVFRAGMGAAENFWGKWTGNGGVNNDIDHPEGEIEANHSHPEGNKTYWWHLPGSDCPNDDVAGECPGHPDHTLCCSGKTLEECKEMCASTKGCGGFNFPHGILKKTDCLSNRRSGPQDLYVLESTPQPPPPPPPQWVGSWALTDRYNHFLCFLRNFGVVSPPVMPSYCTTHP